MSKQNQSFTNQEQKAHEKWLETKYGEKAGLIIKQSKSAPFIDENIKDLEIVERKLIIAYESGAPNDDKFIVELIKEHHSIIERMWGTECSVNAYVGLAEVYAAHEGFVKRFEEMSLGFSNWLPKIMRLHSTKVTSSW